LLGDATSAQESELAAPAPVGPSYSCATIGGATCTAACPAVSARGCVLDQVASGGANLPARQCFYENGQPQIVCYYLCIGQVPPDRELVGCAVQAPVVNAFDAIEP
jgi:hypothetical protein